MFIIFIGVKISVIKFEVLNQSVCKLVMIYNNVPQYQNEINNYKNEKSYNKIVNE